MNWGRGSGTFMATTWKLFLFCPLDSTTNPNTYLIITIQKASFNPAPLAVHAQGHEGHVYPRGHVARLTKVPPGRGGEGQLSRPDLLGHDGHEPDRQAIVNSTVFAKLVQRWRGQDGHHVQWALPLVEGVGGTRPGIGKKRVVAKGDCGGLLLRFCFPGQS